MPYVRSAKERNPNVKNDVIFDEGRLVWLNDTKLWGGLVLFCDNSLEKERKNEVHWVKYD